MSGIGSAIAPRYQVILGTAHISKRAAHQYLSKISKAVEAHNNFKDSASAHAGAKMPKIDFKLPVSVSAYKIFDPIEQQKFQGFVQDHDITLSPPKSNSSDPQALLDQERYTMVGACDAGEDSLFHVINGYNLLFGVADGVGGWVESGVDPSIFARTLTSYTAQVAKNMWQLHSSDSIDPKQVLSRAYAWMRHDDLDLYGSSTMLIGSFNLLTGKLLVSQLGDSAFLTFDRSIKRITHVSSEQEHRFNMPYQLTGKMPSSNSSTFPPNPSTQPSFSFVPGPNYPDSLNLDFKDLAKQRLDTPNDASVYQDELFGNNKLLLMATDGLFDNVFVDEIEEIISSPYNSPNPMDNIKSAMFNLAQSAVLAYIQHDSKTPFSEEAKKSGYSYKGGKPDDITIVAMFSQNHPLLKGKL
ncbi:hypothetical protein BB560_003959 [Smittium megazygosporum]|uniref:Protein phosphatase n=1 Tax=Smittium megazygosporum TaxID=133381 RepID=A0A2T9ZAL1_9FUNG|nr:hypothetical protein BB560_005096 [Smittium megazygosporum]PVV01618.1 hypothetical protein BB560_003959 [Smittium megazygosporum]